MTNIYIFNSLSVIGVMVVSALMVNIGYQFTPVFILTIASIIQIILLTRLYVIK
jgi:hypothetical protein